MSSLCLNFSLLSTSSCKQSKALWNYCYWFYMAEFNFPEEYVFPCVAIFLAFFLFLSRTHTFGALPQTRSINSWHCVKSSRIYNYSTNIQFPLPSWKILACCSLRDSWVRELRRREHRNKTGGNWREEERPPFPDFPCLTLLYEILEQAK